MLVKELIEKLKEFDGDLEVSITDGYNWTGYHTDNIEIALFEESDCKTLVDIGIGGCQI